MLQKKLGSIENESRTNIKKGKRKKERTADKKRKVKQKKYRTNKNKKIEIVPYEDFSDENFFQMNLEFITGYSEMFFGDSLLLASIQTIFLNQ